MLQVKIIAKWGKNEREVCDYNYYYKYQLFLLKKVT